MPTLNSRFHARNADGIVHPEIPAGLGLHYAGPRVQVTISPLQDQSKPKAIAGETPMRSCISHDKVVTHDP